MNIMFLIHCILDAVDLRKVRDNQVLLLPVNVGHCVLQWGCTTIHGWLDELFFVF